MTSRSELLESMRRLADRGISCAACRGTCCTFEANSMRIDPEEARRVADYLVKKPEALGHWRERLEHAVERFGLGRSEAGDGRRALTRRRYTCPFYEEPGCALPFDVKPLGCLAFNPRSPGLTQGGDCGTAGVEPVQGAELAPIPLAVLAALS